MRRSVMAAGVVSVAGLAVGPRAAGALHAGPMAGAGPVETSVIAKSGRGRAISMWRVGSPEPDALGRGPDERPAILIVAGLDGRHDFGTRVALSLVDRLVGDQAQWLDRYTVYIVPDMNPDNDALFDRPDIPKAEFGRAPKSEDADHDGRFDEDPADDLNADGMITMMRVKDPAPGSGLTATLVLDPDEPRVLRAPDASKGEIADYALLIEGIDNDGDGRFNEDGFAGSAGAGVDLDRNFPSLWPEHRDGAGEYQLSRPETRGLVEWMMARDNIVCVLTYTAADNILNTPPTGQYAPDGREPTGIEDGDKAVYEKVKAAFEEATRETEAPKGEWAGSLTQYAYAQFGVWSFATPAWVRPDQVKPEQKPAEENGGGDAPAAGDRGDRPGRGGSDPDAERRALQARGVPAFIIDFIEATPDERASIMEGFDQLPENERTARMQAVTALPEDVQLRVRALISGQPDPGPGGGDGGGGEQGRSSGGPPDGGGGPPPGGRSGRFGGRGGRPGGAGGPRGGTGSPGAAPSGDEAKWIKYSDEHLDGKGFVEWTKVQHPQLGEVEVGGLVPGIRHEPPESEWPRIVDEQAQFLGKLLGMMPDLVVKTQSVERVAPGVWRIRVRGTDPGELPTRAAIGVKTRRLPPIVVSVGVEPDDILVGQKYARWDAIAGHGAYEEAEWTVKAPDGSSVAVEVRSSVFGNRTLNIELKEGE